MNDDLRERLDDLEQATTDTAPDGWLVAYRIGEDTDRLVDRDGEPIQEDTEPDVVISRGLSRVFGPEVVR